MDLDFDIPGELPDDVLFGEGGDELFNFDQEFGFSGLEGLPESGTVDATVPPETYEAPAFYPFCSLSSNVKTRSTNFPFLRKVHTSSVKASNLTANDEAGLIKDLQKTFQLFSYQRQFLVKQVLELDKWMDTVYPGQEHQGIGDEKDLLVPVEIISTDLKTELGLRDAYLELKPLGSQAAQPPSASAGAALSDTTSRISTDSVPVKSAKSARRKGSSTGISAAASKVDSLTPSATAPSRFAGLSATLKVKLKCSEVTPSIIQELLLADLKATKPKATKPKSKTEAGSKVASSSQSSKASASAAKPKGKAGGSKPKPIPRPASPSTVQGMWDFANSEGYFAPISESCLSALSLEPERTVLNVTCVIPDEPPPGSTSLKRSRPSGFLANSLANERACCRAGKLIVKRRKKPTPDSLTGVTVDTKYDWKGGHSCMEKVIACFAAASCSSAASKAILDVPIRTEISDFDLDVSSISMEQRLEAQLRSVGLLELESTALKDVRKPRCCAAQDLVRLKSKLSTLNRSINSEMLRLRKLTRDEINWEGQREAEDAADKAKIQKVQELMLVQSKVKESTSNTNDRNMWPPF